MADKTPLSKEEIRNRLRTAMLHTIKALEELHTTESRLMSAMESNAPFEDFQNLAAFGDDIYRACGQIHAAVSEADRVHLEWKRVSLRSKRKRRSK